MSDKEEMTEKLTEEQIKAAEMIDNLSEEILEELRKGNTEVDIKLLMESIEAYASYPTFHEPSVSKWKDRLGEITSLLEVQYQKIQEELKDIVENNPKISAYDKANEVEGEEK